MTITVRQQRVAWYYTCIAESPYEHAVGKATGSGDTIKEAAEAAVDELVEMFEDYQSKKEACSCDVCAVDANAARQEWIDQGKPVHQERP
jgi:hypothetical protein